MMLSSAPAVLTGVHPTITPISVAEAPIVTELKLYWVNVEVIAWVVDNTLLVPVHVPFSIDVAPSSVPVPVVTWTLALLDAAEKFAPAFNHTDSVPVTPWNLVVSMDVTTCPNQIGAVLVLLFARWTLAPYLYPLLPAT